MTNTNCLEGMACPECGSEGPFWITARTRFLVHDDGTEEYTDVEWDSSDWCRCRDCHHEATAGGFKVGSGVELA